MRYLKAMLLIKKIVEVYFKSRSHSITINVRMRTQNSELRSTLWQLFGTNLAGELFFRQFTFVLLPFLLESPSIASSCKLLQSWLALLYIAKKRVLEYFLIFYIKKKHRKDSKKINLKIYTISISWSCTFTFLLETGAERSTGNLNALLWSIWSIGVRDTKKKTRNTVKAVRAFILQYCCSVRCWYQFPWELFLSLTGGRREKIVIKLFCNCFFGGRSNCSSYKNEVPTRLNKIN